MNLCFYRIISYTHPDTSVMYTYIHPLMKMYHQLTTELLIMLFFSSMVPTWTSSSWLIMLFFLNGCFSMTNNVPTVCCYSNFAETHVLSIFKITHKQQRVIIFWCLGCCHYNEQIVSHIQHEKCCIVPWLYHRVITLLVLKLRWHLPLLFEVSVLDSFGSLNTSQHCLVIQQTWIDTASVTAQKFWQM